MEDNKKKLVMIEAVSEVLRIKKEKKGLTPSQVVGEMNPFIRKKRNKLLRLIMLVTVSKTLDLLEKNPRIKEKDAIKRMVDEFDSLIEAIETKI